MLFKPQNTLCIFACHFKNNSIPKYLKLYLQEINKYCSKLLLINSSEAFVINDSHFIKANEIEVLILPNHGHDFGSWMRGLASIDISKYENLVLANDSCLLIQPLDQFFNWAQNEDLDFGGLINSNEKKYHIQSYLTIYNKNGMNELAKQYAKCGILDSKKKIVKQYEIGISQAQLKAKNKVGSMVEVPNSNKSNPLFHQTLELIKHQFPLVKKQLIFNQLSLHDQTAMRSAGIYTGPQVIKDEIIQYTQFKKIDWDDIFKDQPINI